jgi:imidazole glycerol-phosphate synthase subunit HisH
MNVLIVDYGMGNIQSILNALSFLGVKGTASNRPDRIYQADVLILPGVGAFGKAMENLKSLDLIPAINQAVQGEKTPFLGICLGMQLMFTRSQEHGNNLGLDWFSGDIRLGHGDEDWPHVGWNQVESLGRDSILAPATLADQHYYFDHNFFLDVSVDDSRVKGVARYSNLLVPSVFEDGHIFGVQFHPEISQRSGLRLFRNFLNFVEHRQG